MSEFSDSVQNSTKIAMKKLLNYDLPFEAIESHSL